MRNTRRFTFLSIIVVIAAGVCCGLAATSSPVAHQARQNQKAWDPSGTYFVYGDTPKGFKEFKYFDITAVTYIRPGVSKPIKPYGYVQAGHKLKMTRIDVVGESLSFETATFAGVSYQFNGRAVRPYQPNGPDISGWLIKMVNGKKVAEVQVEFDRDDDEGGQ